MYCGRERKLNRLDGYNYSSPGFYFITICTKDRVEYLGQVDLKRFHQKQSMCPKANFIFNGKIFFTIILSAMKSLYITFGNI